MSTVVTRPLPWTSGAGRCAVDSPASSGGRRAGLQRAVVDRCPFAHAVQALAVAVRSAGCRAEAGVGDLHVHRAVGVAEDDLGGCRGPGVLEGVGQRFLHDPVDRELLPLRQPGRVSLHGAGHRQACRPYPVEEGFQVGKAGLRGQVGGPVIVFGQHAEQPAQLAERLPAGAGDRAERLAGSLGGARGGVPAAVGEADDHRQVVRDDVVHLAGDAGTLGCRRELGLRVAFGLGPAGPLLQPRVMRAPVGYGVPEHPDADHRHAELERDPDCVSSAEPAGCCAPR